MIGTDKSPKFLLLYNFHITITLNCLAAHFRLLGLMFDISTIDHQFYRF